MASQITKMDREAAIAVIERSKWTHTRWVRGIRKGRIPREGQRIGGTRTHHEECIRDYLHVLAVLRG